MGGRTVSEPARPLAGLPAGEWKTPFGYSNYLASTGGHIWSVRKGTIMKTTISGNTPYPQLNVTDDSGAVRKMGVHVLVLLAHRGQPEPGQMASHINDVPTDNRLENLVWEDQPANERRKFDNGRPKPVPPPHKPAEKACVRCGHQFKGNGKRCHDCVVEIGEQAAVLLEDGATLDEACKALDYPHPSGLHTLAVKYGGYGQAAKYQRGALIEAFVTLRDRWLERVCSRAPRRGDRA